ncbi:MAG: MaoC family dehydratase [Alphaproteobacteria bacterium]|nr:MaoC family dehydratase [Alphaproteobacteria bacterium]
MRYFEDIPVGLVRETGSHTMDREEILAFAQEFDPQPFHIDEEAARQSIYGGLIASGWHTAAAMMRLIVDGFVGDTASLGSPGFDNLRWLRPVRPGDTIRVRSTCVESIPSRSKPIGICKFQTEVFNQHSETVMTVLTIGMYRRRPVA